VLIPDIYLYSPVLTRWEGIVCYGMHPLIFARDAHHITLRGEGIIDGNGTLWWDTLKRKKREHQDKPIESFEVALAKLNHYAGSEPSGGGGREMQFLRPPLFQCFKCSNVVIEGLTFRSSPFWTIHPVFSDHIYIHNVHIQNLPMHPIPMASI